MKPRARRPAVDWVAVRAGCLGAGRLLPVAPERGFGLHDAESCRVTSSDRMPAPPELSEPRAPESAPGPTVYVCITCRRSGEPEEPRPGALLADAAHAAAAGSGVTVRRVRCLGNCSRGASAAVRHDGAWTYVFGNLDPGCGPALIAAAHLLAAAADGIMPWRDRPEPLKRGLIARIPPPLFEEETA